MWWDSAVGCAASWALDPGSAKAVGAGEGSCVMGERDWVQVCWMWRVSLQMNQYLPGHRFQGTKGFCASPICFLTTSWFQVLSSGVLAGRWKHFHFYFISTFSHSRIPFTSVTSDRSYELETITFGFLNSFKYLPQGNSERIKYYRAIVINLCYSKLVGY